MFVREMRLMKSHLLFYCTLLRVRLGPLSPPLSDDSWALHCQHYAAVKISVKNNLLTVVTLFCSGIEVGTKYLGSKTSTDNDFTLFSHPIAAYKSFSKRFSRNDLFETGMQHQNYPFGHLLLFPHRSPPWNKIVKQETSKYKQGPWCLRQGFFDLWRFYTCRTRH